MVNHITSQGRHWLIAWCLWFTTLWFLSSGTPGPKGGFSIPHFDKILHFGYFFGGAGLLTAWLLARPSDSSTLRTATTVTIVGGLVGALDEFHQSFHPERTGNDLYDWLADLSGSFCGAYIMLMLWGKVHSYLIINKEKNALADSD